MIVTPGKNPIGDDDRAYQSVMRPRNTRGFLLFVLATVPFAIALHLVSEALALGTQSLTFTFVRRHEYLLFLAALDVAAAYHIGCFYWRRRYGLLRATLLRDLPYNGRGASFFLLAWTMQFLFLGITLVAEHAPLHGANWLWVGFFSFVFATMTSCIIAALPKRLTAASIFSYAHRTGLEHRLIKQPCITRPVLRHKGLTTGYRTTLGNRPPPKRHCSRRLALTL